MASVSQCKRMEKGVILVKQNNPPTALFVLMKGTLSVNIAADPLTEIEIEYRKLSHDLDRLNYKYIILDI